MKFLIFHGSYGSSQGDWFPYLKNQLELINQVVIAPQMPVENLSEITKLGEKIAKAKNQNLNNWLEYFKKNSYKLIKNKKDIVFIGHSLGSIFILHAVEKLNIQLDSAIFVSPFLEVPTNKDNWQYDLVNESFYKTDFDFAKLKKLIPVSYVVYGNDDPYIKKEYVVEFGNKMNSSFIEIKGGKHFNTENKFYSFPLVFELCKTRLDAVDYL